MTRLDVTLQSIAFIAPGMPSWAEAQAVLRGTVAYQPAPTIVPPPVRLPPAERRRTGVAVKIALAVGQQAMDAAGIDAATVPAVLSASGGDGDNCSAICETLASDDRQISPTRFHNSVHNAPAGYWSIATGAMTPSTALCAYDGTFGAALLETVCQVHAEQRAVLLIAYDTPYPEPLHSTRPIPDACGVGMLLAPPSGNGIARLSVACCDDPPDILADPGLETLRRTIPVARVLPLLQVLARGETRRIVLDYLDAVRIAVACRPC